MTVFIIWLISILSDTLGQISFKYASLNPESIKKMQFWIALIKNKFFWCGIISYFIGFLTWIAFLDYLPLSTAILLISFNMVSVMLAGRFLFNETLNRYRIVGVIFITIGIVFIAYGFMEWDN